MGPAECVCEAPTMGNSRQKVKGASVLPLEGSGSLRASKELMPREQKGASSYTESSRKMEMSHRTPFPFSLSAPAQLAFPDSVCGVHTHIYAHAWSLSLSPLSPSFSLLPSFPVSLSPSLPPLQSPPHPSLQ